MVAGPGLAHTDSWVAEQKPLLGLSDMCGRPRCLLSVGRVSSARGFFSGLAAPIGAGLIGYSLDHFGFTASVIALTTWMLLMAATAVFNPAIRTDASMPAASTPRPTPVTQKS